MCINVFHASCLVKFIQYNFYFFVDVRASNWIFKSCLLHGNNDGGFIYAYFIFLHWIFHFIFYYLHTFFHSTSIVCFIFFLFTCDCLCVFCYVLSMPCMKWNLKNAWLLQIMIMILVHLFFYSVYQCYSELSVLCWHLHLWVYTTNIEWHASVVLYTGTFPGNNWLTACYTSNYSTVDE